MGAHGTYYVPKPSHWPLVGSIGLTTTLVGAASWLHADWYGPYIFILGLVILMIMMFGWFGQVIYENQKGLYDLQVDRSFRWAMCWFIFSEVCFFAAFFGALFFARFWSVPLLGGEVHPITHYTLWADFKATWPLLTNPDNQTFVGAKEAMGAWGLAAINTLILLTSGATITWAHWALKLNKQKQLIIGMSCTIALGVLFLILQGYEYHEAYTEMGLTLDAGIYGTTFFMLTGFHGLHVTIGTIMLIVILIRCVKGHFTPERHFAFEGVAWYWHFVDVVWLFLFVFVYWL
ncbi:cytochrome c oxidase subunit 3 [Legionella israelensis]|uniref:cytochrome-c oxidase n=1 Tax=Legionella israelensis TaxID=454 RepID=A0A0W0WGR3_9GAMM|nr:cytochrome c oxidase subunit 3 [Legionella israelensis]KTD31535.1 cytochrome c oxidase, subunit III [Legionella israelensis]QBS09460.1 cytochrome c oxidase subunit 3 [Legionella israelensis]QDP71693.1 cytochrome c oxidase subunit 3 [Legionella israelensis]SCX95859.1 cytochrome c oxidase subunit 3 [Legionella israelensis DSM 19235]STX60366.1 cytochrome c oxidase subunit III [Legionella israelensis]